MPEQSVLPKSRRSRPRPTPRQRPKGNLHAPVLSPLPSCSFHLGTTDRENHQQLNDGWAKPLWVSAHQHPEADGGDSGPKLILLEWNVRNAGGFLLPRQWGGRGRTGQQRQVLAIFTSSVFLQRPHAAQEQIPSQLEN